VGDNPPPTACDALQTTRVSPLTFDVLSRRGATGLAVSEAVALAALRGAEADVKPGLLVLLSGGNADPDAYAQVLAGKD